MNTYLAIITTVLVLTQIIRVTQNAIQTHRQNVIFKKQCAEFVDMDIRKKDFETQRKAYELIVEYLEPRLSAKQKPIDFKEFDKIMQESPIRYYGYVGYEPHEDNN